MNKEKPVAIISAILQKKDKGKTWVYLQERWKPKTSPTYSGMIEIPAGGIDGYENVYKALKREVKEECGLDIARVVNDFKSNIDEPRRHDKAFIFKPFICQQVLSTNKGLPWVGFVFICDVKGKVKINKKEARNGHWVTIDELRQLVRKSPAKIFPLQLPVLKYYISMTGSKD